MCSFVCASMCFCLAFSFFDFNVNVNDQIFTSRSLKSRSAQGREAAQAEMEERTKVCEDLRGIQEWLVSAGTVLSQLERVPKAERLQVFN